MRIRLVTDASVGKGGFNITYQKGKYKFSQTKLWPSVRLKVRNYSTRYTLNVKQVPDVIMVLNVWVGYFFVSMGTC